ncbi:MAG: hypothetical protein GX242_04420 [Clostridiales bacterium]|nr:hypothetical protein [Clostridiales bacterium]
MKKEPKGNLLRLRQIILSDDINIPNSTVEILKTDTKNFFNNHFKMDNNSFEMHISVDDDGFYQVNLNFKAMDMYDIKVIK